MKYLPILCCLVYFVSYVTRINYQAALSEIVTDLEITRQLASIAVTGSFITYGAGQIISGFIGDKMKPQNVILVGIIGTSFINVLVFLFPNIYFMNTVWCFNGFFQSMIWPPLVRSMSENFTLEYYKKGSTLVSVACSVATIGIYFLVSFFVEYFSWKNTFYFCAIMGIVTGRGRLLRSTFIIRERR